MALLPQRVGAQIVNVQGALAKPPASDGITGQLELKVDWREGNNTLFDVGATGNVLVRRGRLIGLAIARAEYGTSADLTFKEKTFEHLRARISLDCRWRWEVFAQHELDRFRRLNVRAVAGTGPALQLVDTEEISLLAGAAYMLEHERLDDRMDASDAGARITSHRGSLYLTGQEKLGKTAAIVQTVYVQPRLDELSDVRVFGELAVTSKLSRRVALIDGITLAYDRTPPEGIKRYDLQLRIALLITF